MQMRGSPRRGPVLPCLGLSLQNRACWAFCLEAAEKDRGKAIPGHPLNRCIESLDKKWVWSWQVLRPVAWTEWEGVTRQPFFGLCFGHRMQQLWICFQDGESSSPGMPFMCPVGFSPRPEMEGWQKLGEAKTIFVRTAGLYGQQDSNKVGIKPSFFYRMVPTHTPSSHHLPPALPPLCSGLSSFAWILFIADFNSAIKPNMAWRGGKEECFNFLQSNWENKTCIQKHCPPWGSRIILDTQYRLGTWGFRVGRFLRTVQDGSLSLLLFVKQLEKDAITSYVL